MERRQAYLTFVLVMAHSGPRKLTRAKGSIDNSNRVVDTDTSLLRSGSRMCAPTRQSICQFCAFPAVFVFIVFPFRDSVCLGTKELEEVFLKARFVCVNV